MSLEKSPGVKLESMTQTGGLNQQGIIDQGTLANLSSQQGNSWGLQLPDEFHAVISSSVDFTDVSGGASVGGSSEGAPHSPGSGMSAADNARIAQMAMG